MNKRTPEIFCGFDTPYHYLFYCSLRKELSEIFELCSYDTGYFFEKLPKISFNFSSFFKMEKRHYFHSQISLKSLYRSKIWANFPYNSEKLPIFPQKPPFFKILGSSAVKICSFDTKNDFL